MHRPRTYVFIASQSGKAATNVAFELELFLAEAKSYAKHPRPEWLELCAPSPARALARAAISAMLRTLDPDRTVALLEFAGLVCMLPIPCYGADPITPGSNDPDTRSVAFDPKRLPSWTLSIVIGKHLAARMARHRPGREPLDPHALASELEELCADGTLTHDFAPFES